MSAYTDRLDAAVATLRAAGILATWNPGAVTPPCVLVGYREVVWDTLCGDGRGDLMALVIAPPAARDSLGSIFDRIDQVAELLGLTRGEPAVWTPPGADPLPAFQLVAD